MVAKISVEVIVAQMDASLKQIILLVNHNESSIISNLQFFTNKKIGVNVFHLHIKYLLCKVFFK